jgi:Plasma-membrane choline transporter
MTAATAVRQVAGMWIVAGVFLIVSMGWSMIWFVGVANAFGSNQKLAVCLYCVSFYWVLSVLHKTMHVTVTGAIGSWWFVPNVPNRRGEGQALSSFGSSSFGGSLCRAVTYSFGSICLGTFLAPFVETLRLLERMKKSKPHNFLLRIVQWISACLLVCLKDTVEVSSLEIVPR